MRILLVEDEAEMAGALASALKRYDMIVDHVPTLAEAEEAISADVHAAVLLDRQLPDGDGLALIPKLRARADGVPIIVLTARGELADRVAGLDSGADDYLAKPFAVEELLARLRAVLRRPAGVQPDIIRAGRLAFDFGHREASVDGAPLELPRRELLVLEALVRRMGRTVLRSALEEAVYSFDDEIQSNAPRYACLAAAPQARRSRRARGDPRHPRRRLSPEETAVSRHADPYCLRSRLSWRLLSLQAALLVALVVVIIGALCATGFVLVQRDEDRVIDVVQNALARDAAGGLTLRPTR